MEGNLLVVHGGGPTAVLNASLYGVIREAQKNPDIKKIYGAIGGSEAILTENFLDMGELEDEKIELLLQTPGTAIGSSRFPLEQEQYEAMVDILKKNDIKYVLFNGGNGSMDTCGKVSKVCADEGIYVVGIPKTMDNDISIIDHAPGFPSAAKYIATVTKEVGADVKSLPIHVCVIEAMGRNAGWITAASVLARKEPGDAPHLVYLPERNFKEEEFLEDVKRLYDELGGVVVVVSEGLRNEKGESIVPPIFKTDRAVYYGDVSAYLAELVIKKLGIKARSEAGALRKNFHAAAVKGGQGRGGFSRKRSGKGGRSRAYGRYGRHSEERRGGIWNRDSAHTDRRGDVKRAGDAGRLYQRERKRYYGVVCPVV